jgi:hypothetical protein
VYRAKKEKPSTEGCGVGERRGIYDPSGATKWRGTSVIIDDPKSNSSEQLRGKERKKPQLAELKCSDPLSERPSSPKTTRRVATRARGAAAADVRSDYVFGRRQVCGRGIAKRKARRR